MMSIVHLPENVLFSILQLCNTRDLVAFSGTCRLFYRLSKDPLLWKHLCFRDFNVHPEPCETSSYEETYKNVLSKYGCMLGLYQSQLGPFGELLEIRFQAGSIEGVAWEPTSNVMEPLLETVVFSINGNKMPIKTLCLPNTHPHECSLHIDKRKGTVTQHCSAAKEHVRAVSSMEHAGGDTGFSLKMVFLNDVISAGLIYKPLLLPEPNDIPSELRRKDGSFPRQIIAPGLFKGTYSLHGIELLLFRYKDEHEIHGHKVTGDPNVHASKISVKILLKYPAYPPEEGKNTMEAMKSIEPEFRKTPLDQISEQPFSLPSGCYCDADTPLPSKCVARYHGFGQIAYAGFRRPTFTQTQVMIFSNDLFGVIWSELSSFSLFSRVKETFTTNIVKTVDSCL